MPEKDTPQKTKHSADWFFRGVLARIGDIFDRFTGRRWIPSSSLATSELAERIKKLLDAESRAVPGKGTVVPHNINLKMQWDKFSTDQDGSLKSLQNELLTATIDHINDSLYYTYAPVTLEIKPDYFTEGVRLLVSFDKFADEEIREAEINVTVPSLNVSEVLTKPGADRSDQIDACIAKYNLNGVAKETRLEFPANGRLSVGRTPENGLFIDDASISKIHAALAVTQEGKMSVADTGSTNGTFVGGQRIAYGKATVIEPTDRIKFGVVEVMFDFIARSPEPEMPEEGPQPDTVSIDGFEFTNRISEQKTAASNEIPAEEELEPVPAAVSKTEYDV